MLGEIRSLNLSNSVAIAVYEAWRQCGYARAERAGSLPAAPVREDGKK